MRPVFGEVCRIQGHCNHFSGEVLPGQGIVWDPSSITLYCRGDVKHYSLHCHYTDQSSSSPPQQASNSVQSVQGFCPVGCGTHPAGTANATIKVSAASICSCTWACHGEWVEWVRGSPGTGVSARPPWAALIIKKHSEPKSICTFHSQEQGKKCLIPFIWIVENHYYVTL